jgi:hypothetical protein
LAGCVGDDLVALAKQFLGGVEITGSQKIVGGRPGVPESESVGIGKDTEFTGKKRQSRTLPMLRN